MSKDIVCSGIRPTGNLHLGNYFGALKNFVRLQDEYDCYFFIADYHSLTTHPTPGSIYDDARRILVQYLACGLDPERSTIYLQSDLPETVELYLFFNMNAPVGKDQEQHLEMTRTFAQRFNSMYHAECFPLPQAFNFGNDLVKIPALNGAGKMGKSEGEASTIFLTDEPSVIRKKIMKAKTDLGPTEPNQRKPEEIENLFTLLKVVSTPDTVEHFDTLYNNCQIRYGDLKKQLAEDMVNFTEPFRQRIAELSADEARLRRIMDLGREKAHESARRTIDEVRHIIGYRN